jgi:hypothetical protein
MDNSVRQARWLLASVFGICLGMTILGIFAASTVQ